MVTGVTSSNNIEVDGVPRHVLDARSVVSIYPETKKLGISTTTTTFNAQPACNLHLGRFSRPQPQQRHVHDRAQPATDATPASSLTQAQALPLRCQLLIYTLCHTYQSMAFNKVPHERLMATVEAHGIRGNYSRWIRNWLTGRTQRVVIHGQASDSTLVTSGVPQGSVLGPLLFIIYNLHQ
ncbi:Reverse transcriptase domain [Trinorchestia longiramus]|nr:Reverse transcriptase domain [Trinorchestia longiramus]